MRAFDRFYRRHPNIAFSVMAAICGVVLYLAYDADSQNTADLRWQMAATRGAT